MVTRRPGVGTTRQNIVALQEQVVRLTGLVEAQQQRIEHQEGEIAALHSAQAAASPLTSDKTTSDKTTSDKTTSDKTTSDKTTSDKTTSDKTTSDKTRRGRRGATGRAASSATRGRASSRRALLKWGGAAAAAATVALVASEQQGTHAASANDNAGLLIGNANVGTAQTSLAITGTSSASPFFKVDTSDSQATSPIAIQGVSTGGFGVQGTTSTGIGVYGISTYATAIFGSNSSGVAIKGESDTGLDFYASGTGRVRQQQAASAGAPTSGSYSAGEQIRDSTGNLFICTASGNPGTWQQVIAAGGSATASGVTTLTNSGSSGDGLDAYGADGYFGVYGNAGSTTSISAGVFGTSSVGFGVVGISQTGVDVLVGNPFGGSQSRLLQIPQPTPGAPTAGSYATGEQLRDANGELFICVAGGTPGTWVRLVHAVAGANGGATTYLSKPTRLLDTRGDSPNAVHNAGGPISSGTPYTLQVAGVTNLHDSVAIPSTALGAIGKVTVISGDGGTGYVALVPSGSGSPTTGTLPYGANQTIATSFNVGLGGSPGALDIYVGGTSVDVVIDIFAVVA